MENANSPEGGIKNVVLVGGTHGNELTGVSLVRKWREQPRLISRSTFHTSVVHANPRATELARRYVEKDLNRCFLQKDLNDFSLFSYEDDRAKILNNLVGPKNNPKTDFIIDLHSSTANMGLCLIVKGGDRLTYRVIRHLFEFEPQIKVLGGASTREATSVDGLARRGFSIEVGPIAHGTLRADLFQRTERLVYETLNYLDGLGRGESISQNDVRIPIYEPRGMVDYPRDTNGEICAMIHPERQDQDYQKIVKGDPLFMTFDGEPVFYDEDEPAWPVFINEAAYYEKGIAMMVCQRKEAAI